MMMRWVISLGDGVIVHGLNVANIVYPRLIHPTGMAKSFPGTHHPLISRWTRSRDSCSNMDSVRLCIARSDALFLLTVSFRSPSLPCLLGRRRLLFVCADTRVCGLAVGQDGRGKGEDALRDERNGSEMGQALSMGSPLVHSVSRSFDCRSGGFETLEASRRLGLLLSPRCLGIGHDIALRSFDSGLKMYVIPLASFVCTLRCYITYVVSTHPS